MTAADVLLLNKIKEMFFPYAEKIKKNNMIFDFVATTKTKMVNEWSNILRFINRITIRFFKH